ncbi:hypothetical protein Tter_2836 [Thermobaculum terrenum ATCC BAA-798]|uniref:Bacteriophage lambda Replication protein O N-terminal domain-containing protein n=1 Tax=Thermobaculum terrenum (strain ATCC BAA-798 / CCMEE 7001 / YNP1) TaxID=525904 RepID=D1CIZ9_THET1|nr:replication protein [Thermobaculum terrenum]ACZ43719.1 hypothetical protein Tter_2836 [Thermobaculum terrenum ATCC BAA-798]
MPKRQDNNGLPEIDWSRFEGITAPTYTQTPDAVFDWIMPYLTGAELKVLLYIIRRTFGFKKEADAISIEQLCNGIVTRDGRRLDLGTGLKRATVLEALRSLREKNLIIAQQQRDPLTGSKPTVYSLNLRQDYSHSGVYSSIPRSMEEHTPQDAPPYPGVQKGAPQGLPEQDRGVCQEEPNGYAQAYPQQTAQETVKQKTAEELKLISELIKYGVSPSTAQELVEEFDAEHISQQIEMLPHRRPKDPAAVLVKAIRQSWGPPSGYRRSAPADASSGEAGITGEAPAGEADQYAALWARVTDLLAQHLGRPTCNMLFSRARILSAEGDRICVLLAEPWHRTQIKPEHVMAVETVLAMLLGRRVKVEFTA